jgi:hypothetical protein
MLLEPEIKFARVKPHEPPDLEERDPSLRNKSANMSGRHVERNGY